MARAKIAAVLLLPLIFGAGCARSPEARRDKYLARGKALIEKREYSRAILEFRNAAQAMPKDAETYYQLGVAYNAASDYVAAVKAFRKALDLDPKHAQAQLKLAQLMAATDNEDLLKDAQSRLKALLDSNSSNSEMLNALALTQLKLGQTGDAVKNLERALISAPQELSSAVLLARARLQQNDVKGAEDVLKKACEQSPKSVDAAIILGTFYLAQKRPADAEQQFRRALTINPNNTEALFSETTLAYEMGRKKEAEEGFQRLAQSSDKRVKHVYAVFLFQEGRRDEALKKFEQLAKEDPSDRMARTRLVAAYQATNRTADAQKILTAALAKNPKDLDALLQRAELYLSAGKTTQAEGDLNQVVKLKPDAPEVHFALAKLHNARGAMQRSRQELSEALRLNPAFLEARLEMAKALTADHASKSALSLLDQAPEDQKNSLSLIEQRNWILLELGDSAQARRGIQDGLRIQRTADLLIQDAVLKFSQRDYAGSRAAAEEALRASPDDVRAVNVVASTYFAQNQVPAGIQRVREYAAKASKPAAMQQYLGQLLVRYGNPAEARKAFGAAKTSEPGFTNADVALAQLDANDGNLTGARQRLTTVLAANAEDLSARLLLAQIEETSGNFQAAAGHYFKIIETDSNNIVALNNLAYALAEIGRNDEALKYAQRSKELAPDRADVDDTLGWVLYRKGLYGPAVPYLERAASKDKSPLLKYHLAMAYLKAGNSSRGREVLEVALKMNSALPEAKAAQQVLAETSSSPAK